MTSDTFLLAFRRFVARSGLCSTVISDNARTFKTCRIGASTNVESVEPCRWHQLEGHNFIIFSDHRPLTFAFNKISDSFSPRQLRHLDFISQFSTDIRHLSGSCQSKDEELKTLIYSNDLSIKFKPLKMGNALEIFCDVSREKVRLYVPEELRFEVFRTLHNFPSTIDNPIKGHLR
ncbi:transposon Ty3-I Gag-Pol polyprotein [Trichonephila inaurata madagascariensis]|uniref:Transposon Ty3-I Gag-Pol polyprotein n=1 Tax=Trichonephila inaurata madagascariensis TaxID=2747483 RepID=A0A8X7BY08_9ARAC|nr:transposon Ty3-I Gag-Pol polyprotein [Trichonephila inaurata madagascariensis]